METPTDKEIGKFKKQFGPNNKIPTSAYQNIKMHDNHFENMMVVAKDIRRMEQRNPNAYNWHILNAKAKFEEGDLIERMKKKNDEIEDKKDAIKQKLGEKLTNLAS